MYLMYVDESGDTGLVNSNTRYFALTGLVVHELRWRTYLDELIRFRRSMRQSFGLKLREEFHAARFISRPGELAQRIKRHNRLTMIRLFADTLAQMTDLNVVNILVDKEGKQPDYEVFEMAWKALIQRLENTLQHRNFPGPRNPDERALVFCDHTEDKKLIGLMRQLRRFNPVPHSPRWGTGNRNIPLLTLIDDPNFRDSEQSLFVQAADLCAFLLYQREAPNSYMRKTGGKAYFKRLGPILCRVASATDPDGIVRL